MGLRRFHHRAEPYRRSRRPCASLARQPGKPSGYRDRCCRRSHRLCTRLHRRRSHSRRWADSGRRLRTAFRRRAYSTRSRHNARSMSRSGDPDRRHLGAAERTPRDPLRQQNSAPSQDSRLRRIRTRPHRTAPGREVRSGPTRHPGQLRRVRPQGPTATSCHTPLTTWGGSPANANHPDAACGVSRRT